MALPSTTLDSKMFYKRQETTPTPIPKDLTVKHYHFTMRKDIHKRQCLYKVLPKTISYITKITHTKILYKINTHNTKRQSIPQHLSLGYTQNIIYRTAKR